MPPPRYQSAPGVHAPGRNGVEGLTDFFLGKNVSDLSSNVIAGVNAVRAVTGKQAFVIGGAPAVTQPATPDQPIILQAPGARDTGFNLMSLLPSGFRDRIYSDAESDYVNNLRGRAFSTDNLTYIAAAVGIASGGYYLLKQLRKK